MAVVQALVQDAVLRWRKGAESSDHRVEDEETGKLPMQTKQLEDVHLMAAHQHSTA